MTNFSLPLLTRVERHLKKYFFFTNSEKILIACSGGVDSVVLVDILHKLGYNIAICHCNFHLRGNESDEDELFVQRLAESYEIPAFIKQIDLSQYNGNIQNRARKSRYDWFNELAKEHDYQYIATAHHADDNIETVFQNILKGTGIDGLTGIPPKRGQIIRPFLPFFKHELIDYAQKKGLQYREDSSNNSDKYTRNKIRHILIPTLEKIHPKAKDNILTTIQNIKDYALWSKDYLTEWSNKNVIQKNDYQTIKLNQLPQEAVIFTTQLYEIMQPFGVNKEISQSIAKAYFKDNSGKLWYSGEYEMAYSRKELWVQKISTKVIYQNIYPLSNNKGQLELENLILKWSCDYDISTNNLTVRTWRAGDFIRLKGVGKKKLQDYFSDQKLCIFEKERIWLLSHNQEIMWIFPDKKSEKFSQLNPINFELKLL